METEFGKGDSTKISVAFSRLAFGRSISLWRYLATRASPYSLGKIKNTVSFLDDKAVYFKIGLFLLRHLSFS